MSLDELLNENIIDKIYYDELYLAQKYPEEEEYNKIIKDINRISNKILNGTSDKDMKKEFLKYVEKNSIKEGIEAKSQFKLGFSIAVKIIFDSLK